MKNVSFEESDCIRISKTLKIDILRFLIGRQYYPRDYPMLYPKFEADTVRKIVWETVFPGVEGYLSLLRPCATTADKNISKCNCYATAMQVVHRKFNYGVNDLLSFLSLLVAIIANVQPSVRAIAQLEILELGNCFDGHKHSFLYLFLEFEEHEFGDNMISRPMVLQFTWIHTLN